MADVVDIPEFRAFYYTDDTPRQFYTLRRYEDESGAGEMHCYNIAPGLYHDRQIIVNSRIPFNKYKGITILLELETAQTTLNDEFSRWRIDLQKIRTTLCPEGRVLLIKSKQKIDHIFTG